MLFRSGHALVPDVRVLPPAMAACRPPPVTLLCVLPPPCSIPGPQARPLPASCPWPTRVGAADPRRPLVVTVVRSLARATACSCRVCATRLRAALRCARSRRIPFPVSPFVPVVKRRPARQVFGEIPARTRCSFPAAVSSFASVWSCCHVPVSISVPRCRVPTFPGVRSPSCSRCCLFRTPCSRSRRFPVVKPSPFPDVTLCEAR